MAESPVRPDSSTRSVPVPEPNETSVAGRDWIADGTTASEGGGPSVGYGMNLTARAPSPHAEIAPEQLKHTSHPEQAGKTRKGSDMRFLTTAVHGVLDYVIGIALIAAPWVLGFADGGPAMWVPIIIGAGVICYSLLTAYELGVVPAISMPAHLALDIVGGAVLALSPWLFQFQDEVWIPHFVVGLLEIGAGFMTKTTPSRVPRHAGRTSSMPRSAP